MSLYLDTVGRILVQDGRKGHQRRRRGAFVRDNGCAGGPGPSTRPMRARRLLPRRAGKPTVASNEMLAAGRICRGSEGVRDRRLLMAVQRRFAAP
jgi:hypothetical protein